MTHFIDWHFTDVLPLGAAICHEIITMSKTSNELDYYINAWKFKICWTHFTNCYPQYSNLEAQIQNETFVIMVIFLTITPLLSTSWNKIINVTNNIVVACSSQSYISICLFPSITNVETANSTDLIRLHLCTSLALGSSILGFSRLKVMVVPGMDSRVFQEVESNGVIVKSTAMITKVFLHNGSLGVRKVTLHLIWWWTSV